MPIWLLPSKCCNTVCVCTVLPTPMHPEPGQLEGRCTTSSLQDALLNPGARLFSWTSRSKNIASENRRKAWAHLKMQSRIHSPLLCDKQKPYTPAPCKLHIPRIPPSWGIYSNCPREREGARTWGWERKTDLHRKAMKGFGNSAQPGSTLSHLSGHIHSVTIMKLTLLSQWIQEECQTEFIS